MDLQTNLFEQNQNQNRFIYTNTLISLRDLEFFPKFLPSAQAQKLLESLLKSIEWQSTQIEIFGKKHWEPRLTAFYGDDGVNYTYSGRLNRATLWTKELFELKTHLEKQMGVKFNSVLLNYYRSGQDSMGWHSDNEPELGPCPTIASLSLGSSRSFKLRNKKDHQNRLSIELNHGDLLVMKGYLQDDFEHSIAKTTAFKLPRVNLTFRKIV